MGSLCFGGRHGPLSYGRGVGVSVRAKRAAAPSSSGLSPATFSLGEKGGRLSRDRNSGERIVRSRLLAALAANREPDCLFRGAEQRPRLVAAFLLLGGRRRIIDDAGARLDMHEPVLHHRGA